MTEKDTPMIFEQWLRNWIQTPRRPSFGEEQRAKKLAKELKVPNRPAVYLIIDLQECWNAALAARPRQDLQDELAHTQAERDGDLNSWFRVVVDRVGIDVARVQGGYSIQDLQEAIMQAIEQRDTLLAARPVAPQDDVDDLDEWLTDIVYAGRGQMVLATTEDGAVGVILHDRADENQKCDGVGDTVMEALRRAMERTAGVHKCQMTIYTPMEEHERVSQN